MGASSAGARHWKRQLLRASGPYSGQEQHPGSSRRTAGRPKTRHATAAARTWLALRANTKSSASMTLDLPLPLGPTTAVNDCTHTRTRTHTHTHGARPTRGPSVRARAKVRSDGPGNKLPAKAVPWLLAGCYPTSMTGRFMGTTYADAGATCTHLVERPHPLLPGVRLEVLQHHLLYHQPPLTTPLMHAATVRLHRCCHGRWDGSAAAPPRVKDNVRRAARAKWRYVEDWRGRKCWGGSYGADEVEPSDSVPSAASLSPLPPRVCRPCKVEPGCRAHRGEGRSC